MAATRFHEMVGHLRGMELDEHDNDLEVSFVQQFQSMRQHGGVQKEVSGKRPEGTYTLHIRLLRTFRQVVKPGELKGNKLICARRTIKVKRKASSDGLRRALLQAFPHLTGSFFEICFLQNGALCAVNMAHDMRTLKAILGPRAKIFVRPQVVFSFSRWLRLLVNNMYLYHYREPHTLVMEDLLLRPVWLRLLVNNMYLYHYREPHTLVMEDLLLRPVWLRLLVNNMYLYHYREPHTLVMEDLLLRPVLEIKAGISNLRFIGLLLHHTNNSDISSNPAFSFFQQNLTSRPPRRQAAVAGRLQVREWAGRVTPLNSPSIDLMTGTQDDSAEEGSGIDNGGQSQTAIRAEQDRAYNASLFIDRMRVRRMRAHDLPSEPAACSGFLLTCRGGGQRRFLPTDSAETLRNWIGSQDGATRYFRISLHGAPEMPPSWLMHDMSLREMGISVDATVDIQWNLNGPEADENTGPEERLETVIEKWQSNTKITFTQDIKVSRDPPGELLRQALQIYKRRAFDARKTPQVNMA
ncbi:hypothetical protein BaRGS_00019581 [Batillaria attramentaria]|uniref:Ubiquitin-like domain-containing protein n=1 Tax=Batillaria attramentaria TaxID=370345 RepID=A0ABD0KPM4_9CAEN